MHSPWAILKVVAKAMLNAVGGGVAGDVAIDVLPDVARDVARWWHGKSPEERRADLEALARATPAQTRAAAAEIALELAPHHPEQQKILELYLSLVPAAVRQSLRRPGDPEGLAVPESLQLAHDDDVLPFLPSHLPRFRPGDRPLPGIDWELVELLGSGGFGEVWKARNPHFDGLAPVALKFCLAPSAHERLLRHEAAILNQVMRQGRHPGIVALQHTYLGADPPCLEYEFVSGGDLTGVLTEWRSLPPGPSRVQRAARLIAELADIIGFAHRLSPPIVHRDLKPANVLVQPPARPGEMPRLRVSDFGIGSVAAGHVLARTSRTESPVGFLATALRGAHTPLYASPQQVRGQPADVRDDVHALGVIWYQLLTGNLMSGRPGGTRWTRKLEDWGASAEMIALLASCLEEDVNDRPADAAVLAELLNRILEPAAAVAVPADPPRRIVTPPPREVVNSLGMKFRLIPAGTFSMGSPQGEAHRAADEGPIRRVSITRPFSMSVYPVTQKDYEAVMRTNPAQFTRGSGGGPLHPVEQTTWDEAWAFCQKLSERPEEKAAGRRYALPTEAQWEYACRAGRPTVFAFGDILTDALANFDGTRPYGTTAQGRHLQRTTKVGQYPANDWGLFDMHGNVWEWCADWYTDTLTGLDTTDPKGPARGTARVLRGGSWNSSGHLCRSAKRNKHAADFRSDTIGFRVVIVWE